MPDAAILIGGQSSRMGFPKSLLRNGEESILVRIVAAANQVAREVVLVGEAPLPTAVAGVARLDDIPGVQGPLGGVLAACRRQPERAWIILSCDLPFMSAAALRWLLSFRNDKTPAVMPHLETPDMPEPLAALYLPAAGPVLENAAQRGERSLLRILVPGSVVSPKPPRHLRKAFRNVNTPEAWLEVLKERWSSADSKLHEAS
jgi:molybdopterin-guanine dinucleotide biosynthesis protein A